MNWKGFLELTKLKIVVIIVIFVILEGISYYIGSQSPNTITCEICQCDFTIGACLPCNCPDNSGALAIPLMLILILPNLIIACIITNIIFYFKK